MKRLEKIYKPKQILKNTNKNNCVLKNIKDNENITLIENIFKNKYPFYKKVYIKTKDKEYKTYLLRKYDNKIKTISDIEIYYDQIEEIKII